MSVPEGPAATVNRVLCSLVAAGCAEDLDPTASVARSSGGSADDEAVPDRSPRRSSLTLPGPGVSRLRPIASEPSTAVGTPAIGMPASLPDPAWVENLLGETARLRRPAPTRKLRRDRSNFSRGQGRE